LKFTPQTISDVILIEPKFHNDSRGYFSEVFRKDLLEEIIGYKVDFVQDSESKSEKGVLRGLHFQLPPYTQAKLVRVLEGKVLDVAVDIRKNSATFGQYVSVELSKENKKQLYVPRGFAHGFVVLSSSAVFSYKVDNYYSPEHDKGLAYNDKDLNIDWKLPLNELKISKKDKNQSNLNEINVQFE
jgi:dTDP-4-dehydrorhamnose 3,5-epimerase